MASGSKFSFTDMQNPLFLHSSDNPLSISVTKIQGADDYRSWKRSMEIQLLSKRKLGFVQGTELRSTTYTTEALQWDTCNSMCFVGRVGLYELLPSVFTTGDDVSKLLKAIATQKEEARLFQFLNGLDEVYGPQRSQLLMITPLPSVEMTCATIQHEESQRDVLKTVSPFDNDMSAMMNKTTLIDKRYVCSTCGGKGHSNDKCWNIVGYPKWHYKSPSFSRHQTPKWPNTRQHFSPKGANAATVSVGPSDVDNTQQPIVLSTQQFQHLLQLIPKQSQSNVHYSDNVLDSPFSGMVTCNSAKVNSNVWIVDTGATDHMTPDFGILKNVKTSKGNLTVNLPTAAKANVTHVGDVHLECGLKLLNVLYVPIFTHNLLSIQKLSQDNNCYAIFSPSLCTIVESETNKVRSKGTVSNGLYHLSNLASKDVPKICEQQCLSV
ncbi:uncharacterized protein LOC141660163 [Apium graveolens]|uniref:uncharacterized protein LOC141660163 n=1 Tax=Apium graveolens TaxID=4045 RepID=UPI003D7BE0A7